MTPEDRIAALKKLLFREAAMRLFEYQKREHEEETREWDDLDEEEIKARMEIAATFLKYEAREVIGDD